MQIKPIHNQFVSALEVIIKKSLRIVEQRCLSLSFIMLFLVQTGCQGSLGQSREGTSTENPNFQAKKVEFSSLATYRISEGITTIDLKEVYIGSKALSEPVTWVNTGKKVGIVEDIEIVSSGDDVFSVHLIGKPNPKVQGAHAYPHVVFVFHPAKAGKFEAIARPRFTGNGHAEEIRLRGIGVAVRNRGKLLSLDIPDSLRKGLDFGRIAVGTSSKRKFQLMNLDRFKAIEISEIIVSSDFKVSRVTRADSGVYNGPVRSFTIPKHSSVEVTLEFTPPPGFQEKEKIFGGSIEFRSKTGDSQTGTALCGIAFHHPDLGPGRTCYP